MWPKPIAVHGDINMHQKGYENKSKSSSNTHLFTGIASLFELVTVIHVSQRDILCVLAMRKLWISRFSFAGPWIS